MTRIDYIFIPQALLHGASLYRVSTAPIVESDHHLVSATINASLKPKEPRSNAASSLNTRILADAGFMTEIRAALQNLINKRANNPLAYNSVGAFWDACKARFLLLGQQHENKQCNANRRQRTRLQKDLKEAGRARKAIVSLQDASGTSANNPESMAEIVRAFYTNLYRSQPTDKRAQDELLECVAKSASERTCAELDADLSLDEVSSSIDSMANRSSPGSDNLPYEFYKTFKDDVAPILLELFNSIDSNSGSLSPSHRFALTTLIFKKSDQEQMKNYRPVSLTQTDYKIFTKALTNRINKAVDQVVEKWQTGFIPGRQGHDNVMMLELLTKHVEDGRRGRVMLLSLDQETAYDRVEWDYLHRVLEGFGFGPRVRNWIRCRYTNLSASLSLNGRQTAPYTVERGLRQSDPLTPILFKLVLEFFLLHFAFHAKGVEAVAEPFKAGAFADDTVLGLGLGDEGVALRAIKLHERALRAEINADKTEMIPLTAQATEAFVFPNFELLPHGTAFKHLSVMIQPTGRQIGPIEQDLLRDLGRMVATWHLRRLSFSGRVTVTSTYFLSKLWACRTVL